MAKRHGIAPQIEVGQFAELGAAVLRSLPRDIDPTTVQGWVDNPRSLKSILRKSLMPKAAHIQSSQLAENCYKVLVDYGQTLQQMIANGKYDYANSDITSGNFPMTGNGKQEVIVELVHFGRDMASDAVLKEFEARGLRAATLPELLAFGATYPEKQREFPIVALGSVWQNRSGNRYVPYLSRHGSERKLHLSWSGHRWNDYCRFAAVRK